MAVMCEVCKCSIYLEDMPDGSREYGGCESGCECCNNPNWVSEADEVRETLRKVRKVISKSDLKRMRRAIRIADRANDYEIIEWAFGDIEATINKIESKLEKVEK
jgi:Zn-finger protein